MHYKITAQIILWKKNEEWKHKYHILTSNNVGKSLESNSFVLAE
jgi:hypothetical protein